jgi:predicted DNA-binding transcriptional regulator AlpA
MTAEAKRYLDEAAAAQVLNLSRRTLQRWRADGCGPGFIRAGVRRVLYDAAEIERWAAARTYPHRAAELAARATA